MSDENWLEAFLEQIDEAIEAYGWAVRTLDDAEGLSDTPFTHTIGLEELGHCEFVVTGLPGAVASRVLNTLCAALVDGTRAWPTPGSSIDDLLSNGYEVRVLDVDDDIACDDDRFAAAYARRDTREGFRVQQLVWQLADRSWPERDAEHQPLLGSPWW